LIRRQALVPNDYAVSYIGRNSDKSVTSASAVPINADLTGVDLHLISIVNSRGFSTRMKVEIGPRDDLSTTYTWKSGAVTVATFIKIVPNVAGDLAQVRAEIEFGGGNWHRHRNGDPYGNRTRASAVKGPRPNR
jgi:hypothetical protein